MILECGFDALLSPWFVPKMLFATDFFNDIRTSTNDRYVLGKERFKDDVSAMLKRRVLPGKAGRSARLIDRGLSPDSRVLHIDADR